MARLFIHLVRFIGPSFSLNDGPLSVAHEGLNQVPLQGSVPSRIIRFKKIDKLVLIADDDLQCIALLMDVIPFFAAALKDRNNGSGYPILT